MPTAASAASPTAEAVTLTAVAVTATTVQPDSRALAHRQRKAPRAGDREGLRDFADFMIVVQHTVRNL